MDFAAYWDDVTKQRADVLRAWFAADAQVLWPCTGERFTAGEFVRVNCAYPGQWEGAVERVLPVDGGAVMIARVWAADGATACHVTSVFELDDGRISRLTEYYADDGPPPEWRRAMAGEGEAL